MKIFHRKIDPERVKQRKYARRHGYFWLPCPLCDEPFGGHEWNDGYGTIPDLKKSGRGEGVCPTCTKRFKEELGQLWEAIQSIYWKLGEERKEASDNT